LIAPPDEWRRIVLNLSTVMIGSEEPKGLSEFYTKVLGEPAFDDANYVGWAAGSGMLVVGPHSEVKGANDSPGRIILNFETPDFQGEFARVKALGAAVEQEPYQPGEMETEGEFWLATFKDPDGNLFQIASPMPAPSS
jgi:predicted enzyme related to lactoylglutathione lyase